MENKIQNDLVESLCHEIKISEKEIVTLSADNRGLVETQIEHNKEIVKAQGILNKLQNEKKQLDLRLKNNRDKILTIRTGLNSKHKMLSLLRKSDNDNITSTPVKCVVNTTMTKSASCNSLVSQQSFNVSSFNNTIGNDNVNNINLNELFEDDQIKLDQNNNDDLANIDVPQARISQQSNKENPKDNNDVLPSANDDNGNNHYVLTNSHDVIGNINGNLDANNNEIPTTRKEKQHDLISVTKLHNVEGPQNLQANKEITNKDDEPNNPLVNKNSSRKPPKQTSGNDQPSGNENLTSKKTPMINSDENSNLTDGDFPNKAASKSKIDKQPSNPDDKSGKRLNNDSGSGNAKKVKL